MLKPLRCRFELVFFSELLQGWCVEKPHPFICPYGNRHSHNKEQDRAANLRTETVVHARILKGTCKHDNCGVPRVRFLREALSFPCGTRHVHFFQCSDLSAAKLSGWISFWPVRRNPARRRCTIF